MIDILQKQPPDVFYKKDHLWTAASYSEYSKKNYVHLKRKVSSAQLIWVQPTKPGLQVLSRRLYHQWSPMGTTLNVDDP